MTAPDVRFKFKNCVFSQYLTANYIFIYNSSATATISGLKPGFYDASLTITNDQDETATANFVVFSGIGPQGDYNGDSDVDGGDLAGFAAEFGN